jgi:predicted membrane channel-forming protein YqfA (hemolysin III family)
MSFRIAAGLFKNHLRRWHMYYGERLNSMTHFFGVALAAVGGALLIAGAVQDGDP